MPRPYTLRLWDAGERLVAGVEHFELVIEHFDFGSSDRGSLGRS